VLEAECVADWLEYARFKLSGQSSRQQTESGRPAVAETLIVVVVCILLFGGIWLGHNLLGNGPPPDSGTTWGTTWGSPSDPDSRPTRPGDPGHPRGH
jgi:hypothetical protein